MKQITYFTLSVILLATSSNGIIDFSKLPVYTFLRLCIYVFEKQNFLAFVTTIENPSKDF